MDKGPRRVARITRPARVNTPGVRARVANIHAELVNVSATGALVRTTRELSVGSEWPLVLEFEPEPVRLTGKVVRCQRVTLDLPGATWRRQDFAVGMMFTRSTAEALQAIAALGGGSLQVEEIPYRLLVVGEDTKLNDLIAKTVGDVGYLTRLLTDGRAAIEAVRQARPDGVIISVRFDQEPSMWWVFETMSTDPETAKLPIVVCAEPASLRPEHRRYLTGRRARLLLLPFTPEELLTTLDRALREETRD